jgi:hypothetical protein
LSEQSRGSAIKQDGKRKLIAIFGRLVVRLGIVVWVTAAGTGSFFDADVAKQFIGSWIVPSDSPDYDRNRYAAETYGADGTVVAVWYSDPNCKKIAAKFTARWKVQGGFLISMLPNGTTFHDRIARIDGDRMTFLEDDSTTHSRKWGSLCGALVS